MLLRVLFSRQRHGSTARILLCRVVVKDAFRQVPVDPEGAPTFGYAVSGHVVVELRLEFRWRNRLRYWGLVSSAFEHAHTRSTFQNAVVSPHGAAAVENVCIPPSRSSPFVSLPHGYQPVPGIGGNTGGYFSYGTK